MARHRTTLLFLQTLFFQSRTTTISVLFINPQQSVVWKLQHCFPGFPEVLPFQKPLHAFWSLTNLDWRKIFFPPNYSERSILNQNLLLGWLSAAMPSPLLCIPNVGQTSGLKPAARLVLQQILRSGAKLRLWVKPLHNVVI